MRVFSISECSAPQQRCHFCESLKLRQIIRIEDAPAFLGCTTKPNEKDRFLSFHVSVCETCGLIQSDAEPGKVTYSEIHSEALGPTWEAHHTAFADFISQHLKKLSSASPFLEIGASAQPIARRLPLLKGEVFYIDPINQAPFELRNNEAYFSGFFPAISPPKKVRAIAASHVLEHIPQTRAFFHAVEKQLESDGQFFISIPLFETWLKRLYFNALSAEHIIYPFKEQLISLAKSIGCSVEIESYKEHSLFAVFSNFSSKPQTAPSTQTAGEQIDTLQKWSQAFNESIAISSENYRSPLFVTGASHLSQYFILCNPSIEKKITGVLDNSARKWGQRLYGTSTKTFPFAELKSHQNPLVFVTPSPYMEEMKRQILEINPRATIAELSKKG